MEVVQAGNAEPARDRSRDQGLTYPMARRRKPGEPAGLQRLAGACAPRAGGTQRRSELNFSVRAIARFESLRLENDIRGFTRKQLMRPSDSRSCRGFWGSGSRKRRASE